jgi:hypothetical protein
MMKYLKFSFIFCLFFSLKPNLILQSSISDHPDQKNVTWSILICTIKSRKKLFLHLYEKLYTQIKKLNLEDAIEILYCSDNREHSTGFKRNLLLQHSKGTYVNFVDDDDDIHANYIQMIFEKLFENPDCVSLIGILYRTGAYGKCFIHSIKFKSYFEKDNIYYRPPNHLNPIRRDIAIKFKFPDKCSYEDTDWALQVGRSGLLQKEAVIPIPYYFYRDTATVARI